MNKENKDLSLPGQKWPFNQVRAAIEQNNIFDDEYVSKSLDIFKSAQWTRLDYTTALSDMKNVEYARRREERDTRTSHTSAAQRHKPK